LLERGGRNHLLIIIKKFEKRIMHEKSIEIVKGYKSFAGADTQGEFDNTICHFSSELKEL
jgi:hypothetical protein